MLHYRFFFLVQLSGDTQQLGPLLVIDIMPMFVLTRLIVSWLKISSIRRNIRCQQRERNMELSGKWNESHWAQGSCNYSGRDHARPHFCELLFQSLCTPSSRSTSCRQQNLLAITTEQQQSVLPPTDSRLRPDRSKQLTIAETIDAAATWRYRTGISQQTP